MSDTSLRDSAEAEFVQTTLGWNKVKNYTPAVLATTHWGIGLAYLGGISAANVAHVDAAIVYLKKTTRGYSPTATNWKRAFDELSKVSDVSPPPPPKIIYPSTTLYPAEVSP